MKIDEAKQDFVGKDLRVGVDVNLKDASGLEGTVVIGDNTQVLGDVQIKDSVIGRNCTIEAGGQTEPLRHLGQRLHQERGQDQRQRDLQQCQRSARARCWKRGSSWPTTPPSATRPSSRRDVKIWPRKVIEAGATVTANLIWGEKWKKSLFEGAMIKGLSNIELTPEFVRQTRLRLRHDSLPKGSFVLAGRDSNLSSRMLKRSFLGGILSAGVNVRDMKMIPLPVLRYKLKTFGEVGGMSLPPGPGRSGLRSRSSFWTATASISPAPWGKTWSGSSIKENFRRAHHTEPGGITEISNVVDFYREGFLRAIDKEMLKKAAFTVVIDFNYSPASQILPHDPQRTGLRGDRAERLYGRRARKQTGQGQAIRLQQLSKIVASLEAQAGFWLDPTAEAITLVDETGRIHDGSNSCR